MKRIAVAVSLLLLLGTARADDDASKIKAEDAAVEAAVRAAIARVSPSIVEVETLGGMPDKIESPKEDPNGPNGTTDGVLAKKGFKQAFGPSTGIAVAKDLVVTSTFAFKRTPRHIFVTRKDGKSFVATLLGQDESRLLALLRVEGADLAPAPEAKRESIKVGRFAIALGRGLGATEPAVALGIVSATDRIGGKAIQTSAAVSPINYGGPLISIDGEVMGMLAPLTAMGSMGGVELYDSGIGFAVPLEDVRALLPRLEKGETLKPGFLGVSVDQGRTEDGVLVETVQPGSGAEKAGLQAKDLIVAVGGKPVQAYFQLHYALGRLSAGDKVKLEIDRGGKKIEVEVTLGEPPAQPVGPPHMPGMPGPGPQPPAPGPAPPAPKPDDEDK
jgi:serine protease Do